MQYFCNIEICENIKTVQNGQQKLERFKTNLKSEAIEHKEYTFTESDHWADSVSKLGSPSVCLCVYVSVPLFAVLKSLITPIYKGSKFKRPIVKKKCREKLGKDLGLRFSNFCKKKWSNIAAQKKVFF